MNVQRKKCLWVFFKKVAEISPLLFFIIGIVALGFNPANPIHMAYFENNAESHLLDRSSDETSNGIKCENDVNNSNGVLASLLPAQNFFEGNFFSQNQCCKPQHFSTASLRSPPSTSLTK